MIPQYVITFREAFEVILLTVVIYSYLKKTGRGQYTKYLLYGVFGASLASIFLGLSAYTLYITAEVKALFEIGGSFLAVGILTYVIYYMAKSSREMIQNLKAKVERLAIPTWGMFAIGFGITIREGVETILFMIPFFGVDTIENTLAGVILGILSSFILAALIYRLGMNLSIRKFFLYTSILIIVIASGILGYGIHELIEYMEDNGIDIGPLGYYIYNLNIDETNILHESNLIGGILSALIGYASKMEIIRFFAQFGYLFTALWIYLRVSLKK